MFDARTAGFVAVVTSIGALSTVLLYMPMLVAKINLINQQVGGLTLNLSILLIRMLYAHFTLLFS